LAAALPTSGATPAGFSHGVGSGVNALVDCQAGTDRSCHAEPQRGISSGAAADEETLHFVQGRLLRCGSEPVLSVAKTCGEKSRGSLSEFWRDGTRSRG